MNTLIDTLPVDTIKTLAKRYSKLKKARGDSPDVSLMSIQEDLARAIGHRDMHAAQAYWEHKSGPRGVSADTDLPRNDNHANAIVRTVAERLSRWHGWFSVQDLIKNCLAVEAQEWGEEIGDADPEKWISERARKAIEEKRYFKTHNDSLTTTAWLDLQRNLAHLAVRKDRKMQVPLAKTQRVEMMSAEQVDAVAQSCKNDAIIAIDTNAGAGKSFVMQDIAHSYRQAGWKVMATALSWGHTNATAEVLGVGTREARAILPLVEQMKNNRNTLVAGGGRNEPCATPLLVIFDNAEIAPMSVMADLAQEAFSANIPVKILVMGDSRNARPHNALDAVSQNGRTITLHSKSVDPSCDASKEEAGSAHGPDEDAHANRGSKSAVGHQATVLSDKEKSAREVDPAILGRAFLQVLKDPSIVWSDRPFKEFSDAMAARAAVLDKAEKDNANTPQQRPGRSGMR